MSALRTNEMCKKTINRSGLHKKLSNKLINRFFLILWLRKPLFAVSNLIYNNKSRRRHFPQFNRKLMIMSAECEHFLQNKLKISSLGATRHSPRRGKLLSALRTTSRRGKLLSALRTTPRRGKLLSALRATLPEGESFLPSRNTN